MGMAFLENVLANKQTADPLFVHPDVSDKEALLNCSQCHSNDDRHFTLFGEDCVQCHSTDKWSLPTFIHPSSQSRDCNQCHEAPPAHYMQHFKNFRQSRWRAKSQSGGVLCLSSIDFLERY